MALRDYRQCDVCGEKAFYDANLPYLNDPHRELRVAGEIPDPYDNLAGLALDRLGDWAVICLACSKTHRTRIERIEP